MSKKSYEAPCAEMLRLPPDLLEASDEEERWTERY